MKKALSNIFLLVIVIIFQGCHVGTFGTWVNESIDGKEKIQIDALNATLFKNIMSKDIAGVKALMSSVLIKGAGDKIDTVVNVIANAYHTGTYKVLDEYYTKNSTTNITNTLMPTRAKDRNAYKIQYIALNKEMYVSLLVSKDISSNCLILAVYGKYDDKWKLNILQIGQYDILGKTAPDYYDEAQKQYKNGNLINAVNFVSMLPGLATPGATYFKYDSEDEMKTFYSKVLKEANELYKLPKTIDQLKSKPMVFAIVPQTITETGHQGIYPFIKYKSAIDLKDTAALRAENNAMQKIIPGMFKGIDQDTKAILYQAFNQLPDGKTLIKHYGFIQTLK